MLNPKPIVMEENLGMPLKDVLGIIQRRIIKRATYCGIKTLKNPIDFWIYQEIISELRPDVIIEIGVYCGGSILGLAHMCDAIGHGRVVGIDYTFTKLHPIVNKHSRINLVKGDACNKFSTVKKLINPEESVLIIEDSAHSFDNTLRVLRTYSPLVKLGGYIIIEDSICWNGLDIQFVKPPGPYGAIESFLSENQNFVADREREAYLITWNPKGYLRRVREG